MSRTKFTPEEHNEAVKARTYVKAGEPYYTLPDSKSKVYVEKEIEAYTTKAGTEIPHHFVQYSVEPTYIPTEIDDICQEYIEAYCASNNKIDWLMKKLETPVKQPIYEKTIVNGKKEKIEIGKDENGKKLYKIKGYKDIEIPFITLRSDFAREILEMESTTEKVLSWAEKMKLKYGNK